MKISGIYMIQSGIKPERCYIGSAISIKDRWNCHLSNLRRKSHPSRILQHHYNKYGESDLKFSILLGCEKEDLIKNEQFFIDSYKPFFNIRTIAESNLGIKHSEISRKNVSLAHIGINTWMKGRKLSEEIKKKISKGMTGKKASATAIENMRKAQKGKYFSEEHRKKIGDKRRGMKHTEETKLFISKIHKGKIPWNKVKTWHKGKIFSDVS